MVQWPGPHSRENHYHTQEKRGARSYQNLERKPYEVLPQPPQPRAGAFQGAVQLICCDPENRLRDWLSQSDPPRSSSFLPGPPLVEPNKKPEGKEAHQYSLYKCRSHGESTVERTGQGTDKQKLSSIEMTLPPPPPPHAGLPLTLSSQACSPRHCYKARSIQHETAFYQLIPTLA